MAETVLVTQPYGRATQNYIDSLRSLGADVVLLAPHIQEGTIEPVQVTHVSYADYTNVDSWLDAAANIGRDFSVSRIGTTWEFSVGPAALLRERLILPGIRHSHAECFRDKVRMGEFLSDAVLVPQAAPLNGCDVSEIDDQYDKLFPAILKPLCGAANLGVRYVKSRRHLAAAMRKAHAETMNSSFRQKGYQFDNRWLLTRFIPGREFEADVYVVNGEVHFQAIQEKTIVEVTEMDVLEVRTVIPPLSLDEKARDKIQTFIQTLARKVYEFTEEPHFLIYPEFRVSLEDGECYCLEVAYRIGGTWDAVSRAYDVNLFDLAARATLGCEPAKDLPTLPFRAVACQALYSAHPGVFIAIHGVRPNAGCSIETLVPPYHMVTTPRSEYLAFAFAVADAPELAERYMDELLRDVSVATIVATPQRISERPETI